MERVLEVTGLTKRYVATPVLDNLTLTLPKGQIIGLLGPNGNGELYQPKYTAESPEVYAEVTPKS